MNSTLSLASPVCKFFLIYSFAPTSWYSYWIATFPDSLSLGMDKIRIAVDFTITLFILFIYRLQALYQKVLMVTIFSHKIPCPNQFASVFSTLGLSCDVSSNEFGPRFSYGS
ncbi:uncharacterized protein CANTADRAFT_266681 [Suhomyces tanzawaensis NRRL Y-17324]|uniref:Uncharacterized protein n=1 Tax=Suhomyces tanzawaensis NRRL Y-17324 TaxID=984487 RepID=A0A1E4SG33_9ASCO|nr:uncharacterized protein CANTADRAFT_266681 [Suhomyces tanzawaensis NRRL Y-17324]ODV78467.1 hypothetical protein CANTADRAFT_266681 [Suhomyces tanzawaensis NRRL Y-17324]